jgi:hypothetical protein
MLRCATRRVIDMKRAWILACALGFVAAAGFAAEPTDGHDLPAPLLEQGAPASGLCAAKGLGVLFAAGGGGVGPLSTCNATATCESGTVNCSGNNTCAAFDRNCSIGEQGHVTCDGNTTWCPTECDCSGCGDCFTCCRCNGGTFLACLHACGG